MSVLLKIYFVLLMQAAVIFTALPPIEKCKLEDSNCIKKSAQNSLASFIKGIPEAETETLDPMHVDTIKFDLSGLRLTIRDPEIKELKSSVIEKINFDTSKKQLNLKFRCDITLNGKYNADGNLLILPISGDGDVIIKTKQLEVEMKMPYSIVKDSNGKDVIELQSYKYTFDTVGNTHYSLTNLFNGNKQLSDAMLLFMNDNWKVLSQEFGKPIMEKPILKIYTAIKTYLKTQPLENIILN